MGLSIGPTNVFGGTRPELKLRRPEQKPTLDYSPADLADVQSTLDYTFRKQRLLALALDQRPPNFDTHKRLALLGDRALQSVLTRAVCRGAFLPLKETAIGRVATYLARNDVLAGYMRRTGLKDFIRPVPGSGWKLGDFAEALIGAAYLDGGGVASATIVNSLFGADLTLANIQGYLTPDEYIAVTGSELSSMEKSIGRFFCPEGHHRERAVRQAVRALVGRVPRKGRKEALESRFNLKLYCTIAICDEFAFPGANQIALRAIGKAAMQVRVLRLLLRSVEEHPDIFSLQQARDAAVREQPTILKELCGSIPSAVYAAAAPRTETETYYALMGACRVADWSSSTSTHSFVVDKHAQHWACLVNLEFWRERVEEAERRAQAEH